MALVNMMRVGEIWLGGGFSGGGFYLAVMFVYWVGGMYECGEFVFGEERRGVDKEKKGQPEKRKEGGSSDFRRIV
jgi:hypothetical protein